MTTTLLILHQHYRPDEPGGALPLSELAEALAARDFQVEAWPCARSLHDPHVRHPILQDMNGVSLWRVSRPAFPVDRPWGRTAANLWTLLEWAWRILFNPSPDIVLIGTDPPYAHLLAPWIRFRWGRSRLVLWCRELHPEYAMAEAFTWKRPWRTRLFRWWMSGSYAPLHQVVDAGPCMRSRFMPDPPGAGKDGIATPPGNPSGARDAKDGGPPDGPAGEGAPKTPSPPDAIERFADGLLGVRDRFRRPLFAAGGYRVRRIETIPRCALTEPPGPLPVDEKEKSALLGTGPAGWPLLFLMYSGTLGRPHGYEWTLRLARAIRDQHHAMRTAREQINRPDEAAMGGLNSMGMGLAFAETRPPVGLLFGVRGARVEGLRAALGPDDSHVRIVPCAPRDGLRARLAAADVHVVSLNPAFTGTFVPSKFFGALAVGRPVLFEGHPGSSIARWIREHGLGWVLGEDNHAVVAADLLAYATDEKRRDDLMRHCHYVYQRNFTRKASAARWEAVLRGVLQEG
jgi:hypothetical protein